MAIRLTVLRGILVEAFRVEIKKRPDRYLLPQAFALLNEDALEQLLCSAFQESNGARLHTAGKMYSIFVEAVICGTQDGQNAGPLFEEPLRSDPSMQSDKRKIAGRMIYEVGRYLAIERTEQKAVIELMQSQVLRKHQAGT